MDVEGLQGLTSKVIADFDENDLKDVAGAIVMALFDQAIIFSTSQLKEVKGARTAAEQHEVCKALSSQRRKSCAVLHKRLS